MNSKADLEAVASIAIMALSVMPVGILGTGLPLYTASRVAIAAAQTMLKTSAAISGIHVFQHCSLWEVLMLVQSDKIEGAPFSPTIGIVCFVMSSSLVLDVVPDNIIAKGWSWHMLLW